MSSLPGLRLEDFLMWYYDISVFGETEANFSLGLAEALGSTPPRPRLDQTEFARLVEMFEPYRQQIEYKLKDFDEETQSWRDYAGYCFSIGEQGDDIHQRGQTLVDTMVAQQPRGVGGS